MSDRKTQSVIRDRRSAFTLFGSYTMLIFGAAVLMIPFLWLVTSSLKSDQEISNLQQIMPQDPQFGNFADSLDFMGMELPVWASTRSASRIDLPDSWSGSSSVTLTNVPEAGRVQAPYAIAVALKGRSEAESPELEIFGVKKMPTGWRYQVRVRDNDLPPDSPKSPEWGGQFQIRDAASRKGSDWEVNPSLRPQGVYFIPPARLEGTLQLTAVEQTTSDEKQIDIAVPLDGRPALIPRFPAFANTIVITVLVLLLSVSSSAVAGYGFARYRFRGREPVFMVMLATMMLPYQITMIPVFLLFRQLGWIDSLLPLIVPFACGNPFFIFMFRQFFMQIPQDLVEAAKLDGASAFRTFGQIMLPLTKPVIAICAIYSFMFTWNDFLAPLIYLNSPEMRTLAIELNAFNGQYGVEQRNLLLAASLITMLPCVLLFFSAQKHFVDSGASGGLKG
ncbi:MAG: multiple sugar transport system permease protein [Phycisphaerales bacterium]|jgi:multiple sugar transport system permease protein